MAWDSIPSLPWLPGYNPDWWPDDFHGCGRGRDGKVVCNFDPWPDRNPPAPGPPPPPPPPPPSVPDTFQPVAKAPAPTLQRIIRAFNPFPTAAASTVGPTYGPSPADRPAPPRTSEPSLFEKLVRQTLFERLLDKEFRRRSQLPRRARARRGHRSTPLPKGRPQRPSSARRVGRAAAGTLADLRYPFGMIVDLWRLYETPQIIPPSRRRTPAGGPRRLGSVAARVRTRGSAPAVQGQRTPAPGRAPAPAAQPVLGEIWGPSQMPQPNFEGFPAPSGQGTLGTPPGLSPGQPEFRWPFQLLTLQQPRARTSSGTPRTARPRAPTQREVGRLQQLQPGLTRFNTPVVGLQPLSAPQGDCGQRANEAKRRQRARRKQCTKFVTKEIRVCQSSSAK